MGKGDGVSSALSSTQQSSKEAPREQLPVFAIDHDDTHAAKPSLSNQSFALMLHGTQPKGSEAADALKVLKRDKVRHSYSRKQASVGYN